MLSTLQILSAFAGASSTTQTAINSMLGRSAGHPLVAAWIGYLVAIIFLTVLAVGLTFRESPRGQLFRFKRRPIWYELLGGACGVFFLAVALNAAPAVGVAVFFALLVAGQLTSSLVLDKIGFLDFKPLPVGAWNVVCVLAALCGAALSSWDELSHLSQPHAFLPSGMEGDTDILEPAVVPTGGQPIVTHIRGGGAGASDGGGSSYTMLLAAGSVAAGMLAPIQASLNTRLSSLLPHKVQGVIVSLLVSISVTTLLLVYIFATSPGGTGPAGSPGAGVSVSSVIENLYSRSFPWQYTGGVFMAAVICCAVFIPASIGASQFYTFLLVGELIASLLFDSTGAFGLEKRPPTITKAFAILAVIVAALGQGGVIRPTDIGLACLEPSSSSSSAAAVVPVVDSASDRDDADTPTNATGHVDGSSNSASAASALYLSPSLTKGPLPTIHERGGSSSHHYLSSSIDLEEASPSASDASSVAFSAISSPAAAAPVSSSATKTKDSDASSADE